MFSVQYRLVLVIYVLSLLWKSINTLSFRKISTPFWNVCIKCQIAGNVGAKTQYLKLVFVLNSKVRLYSTSKHFIYDSLISNLTVVLFWACKTYVSIDKLWNSSCWFLFYDEPDDSFDLLNASQYLARVETCLLIQSIFVHTSSSVYLID